MKTATSRAAYDRRLFLLTFAELTATSAVALTAGAATATFLGYFPYLVLNASEISGIAETGHENLITPWLFIALGMLVGAVVMYAVLRFVGPLIGNSLDARFALLPPTGSNAKGELG